MKLCVDPLARFSHAELGCDGPAEVAVLKAAGMIGRVERVGHGGYIPHQDGRSLRVIAAGDELWGADDQDHDAAPVRLNEDDLLRYSIRVEGVAKQIARTSGLVGQVEVVEPRLVCLGSAETPDGRIDWVLALAPTAELASRLLLTLPSRLPGGRECIAVLCPGLTLPPSEVRTLETLRVFPVCWDSEDPPMASWRPPVSCVAGADRETVLLVLDVPARQLSYHGIEVPLTPFEAKVLGVLAATPGRVLPRGTITSGVLGDDDADWHKQIDKHVTSIRKKLKRAAAAKGKDLDPLPKELLKAGRGSGYGLSLRESQMKVRR